MTAITFRIEIGNKPVAYVPRRDAPGGGGVPTQGDGLAKLEAMVADASQGDLNLPESTGLIPNQG